MALINCPECGHTVSDRAKTCICCGYPLAEDITIKKKDDEVKYCTYCGKSNAQSSVFCGYCGEAFLDVDEMYPEDNTDVLAFQESLGLVCKKDKVGTDLDTIQRQENEWTTQTATCPRCGSTSLHAEKQGFGVGKAVVTTALTGFIDVGAMAGLVGSKNTLVTCLNCGFKYKIDKNGGIKL